MIEMRLDYIYSMASGCPEYQPLGESPGVLCHPMSNAEENENAKSMTVSGGRYNCFLRDLEFFGIDDYIYYICDIT